MQTMVMVSCRRNFWSSTEFSTGEEVRRVDLSSGASASVPHSDFVQQMAGKRVKVLIHGYNNEELDVINAYSTIDSQMRLLGFLGGRSPSYDALVGFAWPGGAVGVSFPFARQRAAESAPRLAKLLSDLRGAGATIDLNTHSLGAHVVFEALREGAPTLVRNAWNFASAVDNESIEFSERYHAASLHCQRFFVFHSKHDPVLRVWYRVGDLWEFDTALGYSGPEDPAAIINHSPHVRVINCKDVVQSHGGYRASGQVWAYMSRELTTPSNEQFVTLSQTPAALTAVFTATGGLLPSSPRRTTTRRRTGRRGR